MVQQCGSWTPLACLPLEPMSKLVCKASFLKSHSYLFRNDNNQSTKCELCDNFAIENAEHIVMHCPYVNIDRVKMLDSIGILENNHNVSFITNQSNMFLTLMGKQVENLDPEIHVHFLMLVAKHVHNMYTKVISARKGIG